MASIDHDIGHKSATNLAITVSSKVTKDALVVNQKGDECVSKIQKAYANVAKAFGNIATYCDSALKNKNIAVDKVKTQLKEAKKKAANQSAACKQRKKDIGYQYAQSEDMYNLMNK